MTRSAPVLRDPTHRLRIGPPTSNEAETLFAAGATSILYGLRGQFKGVYVDDTTPHRDTIAESLVATLSGHTANLVVVSLNPNENPKHRIPGCTTLLEVYPYWHGWKEQWAIFPLPRAEGYITQWNFAFPDTPPPTRRERWKLYWMALRARPSSGMVWWY